MKLSDVNRFIFHTFSTLKFARNLMPKRPGRTLRPTVASKRANLTSMTAKFEYVADPKLTGTATILSTPEKSKQDKKDYRALRLKNGMTVLLISDASYPLDKLDEEEAALAAEGDEEELDEEESDEEDGEEGEDEEDSEDEEMEDDDEAGGPARKSSAQVTGLKLSAASLNVHMGSFSDPWDIQGLAHFLEHMVFMGSSKYPDENSFDAFNRKYGGFDNASTDCDTTSFYFEIPRKNLLEGLDRFAQFFISPLMKKDSMQREREAVDSEFDMALPSDYNRVAQIYGGIAEGHPMSKFMWGNTKSLVPEGMDDDQIHKRLHEFRLRHYSAQYMCLAVQSQHDLDTLQEWIENTFSAVPNNGQPLETWGHLERPFNVDRHHKLFRIHPVKNVDEVILTWALPPLLDKYRTKPLHYLGWIIGHEGKGSLLSYLRKKVWALSLYAGCEGDGFEFNTCFSMFSISVKLTKDGYKNLESVLTSIFSYLAMLKQQGPSSRIFHETQQIEQLDFDYRDEKQPSDNVESLSENMQYYPPERYLDGDDLLFDFEPDIIKQCTEALDFNTVNIFVKSRDIPEEQLDQLEPWFKTKYSETDIPASWQLACKDTSLQSEFDLPEPNIYIAQDLSIREADVDSSKFPVLLLKDGLGELYYKKDDSFLQPRAHIYYHIRSNMQMISIGNAILLDLLVNCVAQLFMEDVYPADVAQLSYSILAADTGLTVKVHGLSDKLPRLLETILEHIVKLTDNITETLFQAVLEETRKNYYNHSIKPSKLVRDLRLSILQDVYYNPHEKHNKIRDFTLDQLKQFAKEFLSKAFLQGLIQGNITAAEARSVDCKVRELLGHGSLETDTVTEIRCREVHSGCHFIQVDSLNSGDTNTLVTNYYQAGPGTIKEDVILQLVNTVMEEPVFDTLRTQEQLGYSVYSNNRNTFGVLGFSITVNTQVTKYSSDHVDERIESFLTMFLDTHLNHEKVMDAVASLAKQKVRADVTLEEEVSRNWSEIVSCEYLFNRYEKEISVLNEISVKEVVEFFTPLVNGQGACRKLSVHVIGAKEKVEQLDTEKDFSLKILKMREHVIHDLEVFKKNLKIHPVLYITK